MKPVFSVVVPAYNEQEVLEQSYERLNAVLAGMGEPFELIFVDDGSKDATAEILRRLAGAHDNVRTLHFFAQFRPSGGCKRRRRRSPRRRHRHH